MQRLNEYLMIALRTAEGINLEVVESGWGATNRKRIEKDLTTYFNSGLVQQQGAAVQLTDEGMLMADGIAAHLFS